MPELAFDPQLSAQLHNKILHHAWVGAGRDPALLPSASWWEASSPVPFDVASRLNPNLICFLRLANMMTLDPKLCFFYFLRSLQVSDQLHSILAGAPLAERFIYLYPSTGAYDEEDVGIVFDQETELAAYVAHQYDIYDMFDQPWAWKSLQDILQAYLEMIEEGKVQASTEEGGEEGLTPRFFPWRYHQHTHRDVVKATQAFTKLLDAIEQRLPQPRAAERPASTSDLDIQLPYSHAILDEATIPAKTFIRNFLSEIPPRTLRFRYIAPGISLQSSAEFTTQPWKESPGPEYGGHSVPFLLFRGDQSTSLSCKAPFYPDPENSLQGVPAGLYICLTGAGSPAVFGNSCRLLLPFNIGARHHARYSNGKQIQEDTPWDETPKDTAHELYQPGPHSGFLEQHEVQLHKVLLNWAERVEAGDWEVNADGVAGGIEKSKKPILWNLGESIRFRCLGEEERLYFSLEAVARNTESGICRKWLVKI